ncbi:class I SAM-dependent methyltransferase [Halorhabdus sp. CBA1104]|uniref:class I SAM-dependent methyltransferase n=1 Tax=Halorhabdus sp. CBA1104 TaxID=1380432 RepID=UPI0012B3D378|nr:class I SAM-dependent methyltransferase [Halorhabdus sp. CBA1104]QGN07401.1 class I SAM-dependent methyltransferase [Halorhabdus sp. CBA1104]
MTDDDTGHRLVAAIYDPLTAPFDERLLGDHREYLARGLDGSVLDLGAGTGAMFPYFAAAATDESSLDCHAIEPDTHMRQRAESRAKDLDLAIDIRPDPAGSLPDDDDSISTVVASLVLCTIPDVQAALDEVARVLKPGGELRLLEHVAADGWTGHLQTAVNPVWKRAAAGCHLNRDTEATLRGHDRFDVRELTTLEMGVPPVQPFIRGTLEVRT